MSIVPEPSTARGDITLQPSYFTSSLYINPLREDISALTALFSGLLNGSPHPFELFKKLWTEQGWSWLHLRAYDGRARQTFIRTTERLFVERLAESEKPLARVVALFSLYTFHSTQPSTSAPPIYSTPNITIPIDVYEATISLPLALQDPALLHLRPYVVNILTSLLDAQTFHVIPHSDLRTQNPSGLPREVFIPEGQDAVTIAQASGAVESRQAVTSAPPKKKGRPSKRDKIRKAKETLAALEKYIDKTTVTVSEHPQQLFSDPSSSNAQRDPIHTIFGQAPHTSLSHYLARKDDLLSTIHADALDANATPDTSRIRNEAALWRANEAVLARLRQIDAMAAERGLEVGGEGGEKTGLERVERAVGELRQYNGMGASGGILGLLEGAGMDIGLKQP